MNLNDKKNELICLLKAYSCGKLDVVKLDEFSWEIIDYFTENPDSSLPVKESNERTFWFAIWSIQHLAGEDESLAKRELAKALSYLTGDSVLPQGSAGKRPT
ncbi:hypothetical protein HNW13_008270 [Shewanella sp. BF02_Schw]|jgi:hypothetical protein|uniref:hypothetical protein n=1 Tax=unclassified Shewanella TaxID=196818 RepID=UPI0017838A47|nr:hypothetical protein [Shewanella sp. BF02_Schw]MBO1895769.1 hypothetical protein [Shewanella sp. BF02_Schw]